MTDEIATQITSPDAASAEEFLFGDSADGALAEVAEEAPAGDATEDAGDLETAERPDAETDVATEEPDVADDADDQTALAETDTAEALKVVLSIKGGRGIIGVQQPSADPHIESFDGLDLSGLAQEVPEVVERARARWEIEPRHPAYVKPSPPAQRQRQRRQAPVEAATEEGETEQEQPETLRLF